MSLDLANLKSKMQAITVRRSFNPRTFKQCLDVSHDLPLFGYHAELLDQCERLCRLWAALFSKYATFALNNDRLRAILRRISHEHHSPDAVGWAILAYADHVQRDPWHAEKGHPHTTLEDFLDPPSGPYLPRRRQDRFEDWLAKGESLRAAISHQPSAVSPGIPNPESRIPEPGNAARRLYVEWKNLPPARKREVLDQAVAAVESKHRAYYGWKDERSPLIRQAIVRILQTGSSGGRVDRPAQAAAQSGALDQSSTPQTRKPAPGGPGAQQEADG